jgi:hypothetical protein
MDDVKPEPEAYRLARLSDAELDAELDRLEREHCADPPSETLREARRIKVKRTYAAEGARR